MKKIDIHTHFIPKHIPDFKMTCKPDYRQAIAESWPASLDDTSAANDWAWKSEYDIDKMTADMLSNLKKKRKY